MKSIVNVMRKYDYRQHVLCDWLAELDQHFQLGEVDEDINKITWCQLLIGATGSGILSSLEEAATGMKLRKLSSPVGHRVSERRSLGHAKKAQERNQRHRGVRRVDREIGQKTPPQGRGGRRTTCSGRLLGGLG